MSRTRKIIISVLAIALVIALAVVGIVVWKNKNAKSVDVYPVSNIYDTYWGDSASLSGNVSNGKVQKITLRDSLVESINVSEGDTVSAGDVLMVYDTTSFQLTLQSDQAKITLLQSNIQLATQKLNSYKTLRPSEDAPKPTEEVVDHGELSIKTALAPADCTGNDLSFNCTGDTTVSIAFLRQLRTTGATATLALYEAGENGSYTKYGTLTLDGSDTAMQPYDITFDSQVTIPGATPEDDVTGTATVTKTIDPLDDLSDWVIGDSVLFTGDGLQLLTGTGAVRFCQVDSFTPETYERYETVYHDNYSPDGSENYMYSKSELAQLILDTEKELASLNLDLKAAQLTYQQDQLVSQTGEVTATISGTVTEVKDVASLASGDALITVKGTENYAVTAYISETNLSKVAVGDSLSVYTYESGNSVTATISEISTTPTSGNYSSGNENPNNSYYPVTATVDDADVELTIGEWCEVTLNSTEQSSSGIYLPLMYVRKDDGGSYVMLADESNRLKKQYVSTGKTLWGYEVEIKAGVSLEDRIAFPYGKTVKEGAPVQDLDYPEY